MHKMVKASMNKEISIGLESTKCIDAILFTAKLDKLKMQNKKVIDSDLIFPEITTGKGIALGSFPNEKTGIIPKNVVHIKFGIIEKSTQHLTRKCKMNDSPKCIKW